jgi:hypothetical protein
MLRTRDLIELEVHTDALQVLRESRLPRSQGTAVGGPPVCGWVKRALLVHK